MATYQRLPVSFERGEGVWLWDASGKKYLDALGGIAVCVLGHAHPSVGRAIAEQAGRLIHTSNIYHIARQEELAKRLASVTGLDRVFFCNSGAEANEAAIKIARLYGHGRGVDAPEIIVSQGAFHGRTLATISASGSKKVQAGFEPLVPGFVRVPYDDLSSLAEAAQEHRNIVAVLIEPIQGEGGIVVPGKDYLRGVRAECDRRGWLMMLDEVQTGMGRTGEWLASQLADISPDVATLAKGLGNGVPIGACLARGEASEVLAPGTHGSTFGGNPLACVAALAVLDTIEQQGLVQHAADMGRRMTKGLGEELSPLRNVREIRGRGLMIGIELERACAGLVSTALERGLLVNVTAERVIRLLPALTITPDEVDQVVALLGESIRAFDHG